MKTYWLRFSPDTFIWMKGQRGLVYNTQNGRSVHFAYTPNVKSLIDKLDILEALYRVEITEEDLCKNDIKLFIDNIVKIEGAELLSKDCDIMRLISFKPELRIRDNIGFYTWRHNNGIGGNIIHNLNNLIFYINGSIYGSDDYLKQTPYPLKNKEILNEDDIVRFASSCEKSSHLSSISLVGNLWEYPNYSSLIDRLQDLGYDLITYCVERDMLSYISEIDSLRNVHFKVLVSDFDNATKLFDTIKKSDIDYIFIIRNDMEYNRVVNLISQFELQNTEIIPLYVNDNLSFFEDEIYIDEDDIMNAHLSKRDIFARQALNVFSFGHLHIVSNGDVYANCNDQTIGNIKDNPSELIYNELTNGRSWLRIRNTQPCSECIYQWLCPSPSNYEIIMKHNLCDIKMI